MEKFNKLYDQLNEDTAITESTEVLDTIQPELKLIRSFLGFLNRSGIGVKTKPEEVDTGDGWIVLKYKFKTDAGFLKGYELGRDLTTSKKYKSSIEFGTVTVKDPSNPTIDYSVFTDGLHVKIENTFNEQIIEGSTTNWTPEVIEITLDRGYEKGGVEVTHFDWTGKTSSASPQRTYYKMIMRYSIDADEIDRVLNLIRSDEPGQVDVEISSEAVEVFKDHKKYKELVKLAKKLK